MNEIIHIQQLQEDQVEAASKVLTRAFQEDPLFVYCFPDPIERKIKNVTFCEYLILNGILYGDVYTTSTDIEGIAVWWPIFKKDQKIENQSKETKRRMRKAKRESFSDHGFAERYGVFTEIQSSFENEHVNFPHWELLIIGVDPIHQGKGYGSKLIRMKLAEIDEQNLPCYLHTEKEGNVKLYEHFGFEFVGKIKVPNSNFYFNGMLRNKKK